MKKLNKGTFNHEKDLYPAIIQLFYRKKCIIFIHVPYFRKRVDMVFTSSTMRKLLAVEVKIHNWQVAIKQASINQLFAQFSYVAMPNWKIKKFNKNTLEFFEQYKVGLISVEKNARIVIPAKRNRYFQRTHHRLVKQKLKTLHYNHKPGYIGGFINAIEKKPRFLEFLPTRTD